MAPSLSYNQMAGQNLERLTTLSDGLFAIAMTLLVLDLKVPQSINVLTERDLWRALVVLSPRLLTYLMSFLTLGIFWVGQQTGFSHFARGNRHLTWLTLGFLFAVSLMPFSTALLAEHITLRIALLIYWGNLVLLGFLLYGTWGYACRAGLMKEGTTSEIRGAIKRRILAGQALYALGAGFCIINPYWSIAFIVLVQLNFVFAPRLRLISRI
jgi:TMEM175 potassium channel family protein